MFADNIIEIAWVLAGGKAFFDEYPAAGQHEFCQAASAVLKTRANYMGLGMVCAVGAGVAGSGVAGSGAAVSGAAGSGVDSEEDQDDLSVLSMLSTSSSDSVKSGGGGVVSIYEKQEIAARNILEIFTELGERERERYCILTAQMQSGKTDTYYLVACEMLRRGVVEHVVVFSGNRETDLFNQHGSTTDQMETFYIKYKQYLRNIGVSNGQGRDIIVKDVKSQINVVWGGNLKREIFKPNTLYIWDESHYAQSKGQQVDKFLKQCGLTATGTNDYFEQTNSFLLSVSATPFSEMSDYRWNKQNKCVVPLLPGETYCGVKWFLNNGKIVPFTLWSDAMVSAIARTSSVGRSTYGLVRVSNKIEMDAKRIAEERGFKWIMYDQKWVGDSLAQILSTEPENPTIVFLKGKCRMGNQVPKSHVSFVIETCSKSNTDTVLQGLLGRMCGYHNNTDIFIYLNERIVNSGELEKFVEMSEVPESLQLPTKGQNLVSESESIKSNKYGLYPRIPVHISKEHITSTDSAGLKADIIAAFNSGDAEFNGEGDVQRAEICELIDATDTKFTLHRLSRTNKTYTRVPEQLKISISTKTATKLGSGSGGCGARASGKEIVMWKVCDNYAGLQIGDVYITCMTKSMPIPTLETSVAADKYIADGGDREIAECIRYKYPKTTGREVFCNTTELAQGFESNGGQLAILKPETCRDTDLMTQSILECIGRSLLRDIDTVLEHPRRISSNRTEAGGWQGILVSPAIYKQMSKGGDIYRRVLSEFPGVKINAKKVSGPAPRSGPFVGFVRLAEIAW